MKLLLLCLFFIIAPSYNSFRSHHVKHQFLFDVSSSKNPSLSENNILNSLNEDQYKAVISPPNSNVLIIAGAGSGKTKVLAHRIAWLRSTVPKFSPSSVFAVTFTNKAAKELQERVHKICTESDSSNNNNNNNNNKLLFRWIGTFHGLAFQILRSNKVAAGIDENKYKILDATEKASIMKKLIKEWDIMQSTASNIKPSFLSDYIEDRKSKCFRASDDKAMPAKRLIQSNFKSQRMKDFAALYQLYEDLCIEKGYLDFDELLIRTYELLSREKDILQRYQNKFKYIIVDEFQDTNSIQYKLLQLLKGNNSTQQRSFFLVGDDDQSIYSFRGADPKIMIQVLTEYPDTQVIKLQQNYRSTGNILTAANNVIKNNKQRVGKSLWTSEDKGESINVMSSKTQEDEAKKVTKQILKFIKSGKFNYGDMGILYRTNAQSTALEMALLDARVPYRLSKGTSFFDREEIRHSVAYVSLLLNKADDISFVRILNVPARGLSAKTLESIGMYASCRGLSLWAASVTLLSSEVIQTILRPKVAVALSKFLSMFTDIESVCARLTPSNIITRLLDSSGLWAKYAEEEDAKDRLNNMMKLIQLSRDTAFIENSFDMSTETEIGVEKLEEQSEVVDSLTSMCGLPAVRAFLTAVTLNSNIDSDSVDVITDFDTESDTKTQVTSNNIQTVNAVRLMTVHSAKGLEFPIVFICGVVSGFMPLERIPDADDDSTDSENMRIRKHKEEERRLFYVALTRAKLFLFISYFTESRFDYIKKLSIKSEPSEFLFELPANVTKNI